MSNEVIILLAVGIVSLIVIAYLVKKYRDKKVSEYLNSLPTRAQTLNLNIRANSGTNLYTGNWRATGKTISVPQYSVDVTINWTDKDGVEQTRSETLLFPNMLSKVGNDDLKEWLTDLMISEARQRLEID